VGTVQNRSQALPFITGRVGRARRSGTVYTVCRPVATVYNCSGTVWAIYRGWTSPTVDVHHAIPLTEEDDVDVDVHGRRKTS